MLCAGEGSLLPGRSFAVERNIWNGASLWTSSARGCCALAKAVCYLGGVLLWRGTSGMEPVCGLLPQEDAVRWRRQSATWEEFCCGEEHLEWSQFVDFFRKRMLCAGEGSLLPGRSFAV